MRVRPESEGNLLCIEYTGAVTKADHENFIRRPASEILRKYGSIRCLSIFTPEFAGWTPEAAKENMRFGLGVLKQCERLAYVNPSRRKILQLKLSAPLLHCPIRYFNLNQIDEALAWIRQKS